MTPTAENTTITTPTTPTPVSSDEERRQRLLTAQATRIIDLQATIKHAQAEIDEISRQILDAYQQPGNYPAGELTVRIQAGTRRIDRKRIETAFPPDKYPQLYTLQVDTKKVRNQFAPDALTAYQLQGDPQVRVIA